MKRAWMITLMVLAAGVTGSVNLRAEPAPQSRLQVEYRVAYRLGFLKLLNLARVTLDLRDEEFLPPGAKQKVPVLAVEVHVKPIDEKNSKKKRLFFDSTFRTLLDPKTFRILFYHKRIRENVNILLVHSNKDYLEEVFYEAKFAKVRREDFLAHTVVESQIDLTAFEKDTPQGNAVTDLTSLVGKSLFEPGYFASFADKDQKIQAHMITKSRAYEFDLETTGNHRVRSPLTGRVKATRVKTDVTFRTRKGEVVPFTVWFTAPKDLPIELRQSLEGGGVYCFPPVLKYEFTLGSLRVLAEKASVGGEKPL